MNHELSAKTKLAIAACQAEPTRIFTQEELAKVMGLPRSQVPLYMKAAVERGLIHRNPLPGVLQFAGTPFATSAGTEARASAAAPAWAPKPMTAPRPGSEQPRRSLASMPPAPTAAPVPTPAPERKLCPNCSRSICQQKGCIAAQTSALIIPAATPAPSPAPAPTPAPTSAPTPAPTPMPATATPEIPRFGAHTAPASTEPSTIRPRVRVSADEPQEFDAWYSVRTGSMRLVGVKVEPDGSVLITPEQLAILEKAWEQRA